MSVFMVVTLVGWVFCYCWRKEEHEHPEDIARAADDDRGRLWFFRIPPDESAYDSRATAVT